MLTHAQIWNAIDRLAARSKMTASGLAKKAGLDPTTFNKSKRITPEGRPRWPSTESVAKALAATNTKVDTFVTLITDGGKQTISSVPLIGFAEAGASGYFDDAGFPVGKGWEQVSFPAITDENAYALEISGDSMKPAYREGDVIIVSPGSPVRCFRCSSCSSRRSCRPWLQLFSRSSVRREISPNPVSSARSRSRMRASSFQGTAVSWTGWTGR